MADVAIIAAAGWKCGGAGVSVPPRTGEISLPLASCPEMLLPLGDGTTVIGRLAMQLRSRGFSLFIAVGHCGCTYPSTVHFITYKKRAHRIPEEDARYGLTGEVWTAERLSYVAQFGPTFFAPDPDKGNIHSTLLAGLDVAGHDWDRWLLLPGDLIFSDSLLDEMFDRPCSCAMWLSDLIFWLDKEGLGRYRQLVRGRTGGRSKHHAMSEKAWLRYPNRHKNAYVEHGIKFLRDAEVGPHWEEVREIDRSPHWYPAALEWVAQSNEDTEHLS